MTRTEKSKINKAAWSAKNAARDKFRPVISWDGEGTASKDGTMYTDGTPQPYVLLANSKREYIESETGLSTQDCLDLLWDSYMKHSKRSIHCMYFGSYDVNMIMKDIDIETARLFDAGEFVQFGNYSVLYMPQKVFIIKSQVDGKVRTMKVWDLIGFYQSSFVTALKKNVPNFPGLQEIIEQKKRRSVFAWDEIEDVKHYCFEELDGMVELVMQLQRDLDECGIKLNKWHGAGAIADAMMKKEGAKHWITTPPPQVENAALHAYAGGRIELWQVGNHVGTLHAYDVNSGYPHGMSEIRQITDGVWESARDLPQDEGAMAMFHIRWDFPAGARGYPFHFRTPDGNIIFPAKGEGWYHLPEILVAIKHGFTSFAILDGWIFRGAPSRPFAWVPEYYTKRQEMKAEGKGAEKVIKLGLNSLYGKTAQTMGYSPADEEHDERRPPYHNIFFAGRITAVCRSMVFDLAMQSPEDVAFIATDCVATLAPRQCTVSKNLGDWSHDIYDRAMLVQPGVYFLWQGAKLKSCYRGFNAGTIAPEDIMYQWSVGKNSMDVLTKRFITYGQALCGGKWWSRHRTWRTVPRALSLWGGGGRKRLFPWWNAYARLDKGFVTGEPGVNESSELSAPYNREWEDGGEELEDGVPTTLYDDGMEESSLRMDDDT